MTGVGISRGSNLLVRLADRHTGLVRRLVLIGAPTDVGTSDSPAQRIEYLNKTTALLANDDLAGLMRYHIGRVFSEPDVADLAASRLKRWLEMPRETVLSFYDRDPDIDIRPLLAAIRLPTLILHGTEDRQVPFAAAEYLAAYIPARSSIPSSATATCPCSPPPRSSAKCCAGSCAPARPTRDFSHLSCFHTGCAANKAQERQHETS